MVLNSFCTQFPSATDVEFKRTTSNYDVRFEIADKDFKAILDSAGSVLMDKREGSWIDLPAEIRSSLGNKYGKKKIEDTELIGQVIWFTIRYG